MKLQQLLSEKKLKKHKTSKKEIQDLLGVIYRDIIDASEVELSPDWRFAIAYNAILQLSTIPLYCKGYKPAGMGHHFIIF